jgi:hypothetical protein
MAKPQSPAPARKKYGARFPLPSRRENLVMMLVTLVYLAFEISFGARLLDVVSSTIVEDELHQIEMAGRIISGIAITLFAWSLIVLPRLRRRKEMRGGRYPWRRAMVQLPLSAAICCFVSYMAQDFLLQKIAYQSSAAQRRAAATLTLFTATAQSDDLVFEGLDLRQIGRDRPEVKTFLAILPALALSVDKLEERTAREVDKALRYRIEDGFGGVRGYFEDVWEPGLQSMESSWNAYLKFAIPYSGARRKAAPEVNRMWREYRSSLGRYSPWNLPKRFHDKTRRQVQRRLPVAANWQPGDEAGFRTAAYSAILAPFQADYDRFCKAQFQHVIPHDLGQEAFFAHDVVQAEWRRRIGVEENIRLKPGFDPDEVRTQVYEPLIEAKVKEARTPYISPVRYFEDRDRLANKGRSAIRVAYIPLIAFFFSIIGAFAHLIKTALFAAKAGLGAENKSRLLLAKSAIMAVVVVLGILIANISNEVTSSRLFTELERQTEAQGGKVIARTIRVVVQMQPYVYPVAETVRGLLGGITFDFDTHNATPLFEAM